MKKMWLVGFIMLFVSACTSEHNAPVYSTGKAYINRSYGDVLEYQDDQNIFHSIRWVGPTPSFDDTKEAIILYKKPQDWDPSRHDYEYQFVSAQIITMKDEKPTQDKEPKDDKEEQPKSEFAWPSPPK